MVLRPIVELPAHCVGGVCVFQWSQGVCCWGAFVLAPDRVSKANWWLCLSPWDPAGCSLKKRHRPPSCRPTTFRRCCRNWVQCVFCSSQGRRPGNSINADQGDMKRNLSGGEGAWARVWGWEIPARYSRVHLNTWLGLWNQSPPLDLPLMRLEAGVGIRVPSACQWMKDL